MIERKGCSDAPPGHKDEARRVDRGKPVKVLTLKESPRFPYIGGSATEYAQALEPIQRILPGNCYIASRVSVEKGKSLKNDRR